MKTRIITALTALFVAVAALAGTTATAPEASARVSSGKYTWTTTKTLTGARGSYPVTIRGNVLTLDIRGTIIGASKHARIHQTRTGGFFDYGGNRYVLRKSGRKYVGEELWLTINGAVVGRTSLTPRR
ncbi:MAG: hypothetical protein WBA38_17475 [Gordonia sp. (in: high G+C Gram-positive bacteria)]|uniref:hypothetical protein n=1 Tax=Gordonia sp. (in: high G+C Gram-positive bacteria) TaxID=84139 RepID=UPI003C779170